MSRLADWGTCHRHLMTQGDSPDQPLVMTPIQFIRPSPLIMGAVSAAKEAKDPFVEGSTNIQVSTGIPNPDT
jgi:hypothetical protein